MKRKLVIISIVMIFLVGVGIMVYPLISAVINNISSRNQADAYLNQTEKLSNAEVDELFEQASSYNHKLNNNVVLTDPFDENAYKSINQDYQQALNTGNNGLIGYVDIPKINVYLPIYHGTSEDVLSMGAGHLANTSLPIGGEGTHSVISAHTGYPTETFFDYLTDLKEGDCFYIRILTKTLKYQVDQIKVVLPDETSDLYVQENKDLITLLTCTPYSVNTHRLLVRGTRVPYTEEEEDKSTESLSMLNFADGAIYFMGYKIPFWIAGVAIFVFITAVVVICILITKKNKKTSHSSNKNCENSNTHIGGE